MSKHQVSSNPDGAALVAEFYEAPLEAYFPRPYISAVTHCSLAKLERDSWRGTGIPFVKYGRQVLYQKSDVLTYLEANKRATAERVAA